MSASRRNLAIAASVVAVIALSAIASAFRSGEPDVPTAEISTGPFVDTVDIRGEIRPFKSVILTAPPDSGMLQIVRIVRDGSRVKAGDVLVEFDASAERVELMADMTELKQARAQVEQQRAEARISREANETLVVKADYDVQRARLDLLGEDLVPRLELERAKLALADAEQRLIEARAKADADARASDESIARAVRRVQRIELEINRRERALDNLQLRAPADGIASIMLNPRNSNPMQPPQEFRAGDQAWPGAQIIELPDLSSMHLLARVGEAERGLVAIGQPATLIVDAIPGSNLTATLTEIALLARPDFSTGFPPGRNFDMKISINGTDERLRPGQSATARVEVGRIENATLVPAEAVFSVNGQATVYRWDGGEFQPVPIDVVRRGREYVAAAGSIAARDRIALVDPTAVDAGGAQ